MKVNVRNPNIWKGYEKNHFGRLRRRTKQRLEGLCEETLLKCLETKEVHDRHQWSTTNLVSNLRILYF